VSENLVDIYYKQLIIDNCPEPGKILSKFYWELFSIPPSVGDIMVFNKLIKLFGREIAFETVVDTYGVNGVNTDKALWPLFLAIAKRKYEAKLVNRTYEDMHEYYIQIKEKVEEIKRENGK
jgi:hypothetical protein